MYKFIILGIIIVAVNCGLLGNVLEEKKNLDNTLNGAASALDKESDRVTGLLAGGGKPDEKSKKEEKTTTAVPAISAQDPGKAETTTAPKERDTPKEKAKTDEKATPAVETNKKEDTPGEKKETA